jgi:hypothetical protein
VRGWVELDRRGAPKLFRACVALLGRARRQVPLLDLLVSHCWSCEMNLSAGGVATKFGLNVAGGIDIGRVVIAKVIDVRGFPLEVDSNSYRSR